MFPCGSPVQSISCTFLVHAVPAGRTSAEVAADIVEVQLPQLAEMIAEGEVRHVAGATLALCCAVGL